MLRLGIIGTGWISDAFAQAALRTNKYVITSIYSRNLDRAVKFGEKYNTVYAEDNIQRFFQSEQFDVVYIASPNSLHFEQAMMAIEHGKHIIVEKPAFSNEDEMGIVLKAAKDKKIFYFEAAKHIHEHNFQRLKELTAKIGTIKGANFTYMKCSSRYEQLMAGEDPNIFSLSYSGGALVDLGVYLVYFAVDLFGIPESKQYYPRLLRTGVDGSGTIIFRYERFDVIMNVGKTTDSCLSNEIYGSEKTMIIDVVNEIQSIILHSIKDKSKSKVDQLIAPDQMSEEANVFADLMLAPDLTQHKERYLQLTKLSKDVNQIISELRRDAGIIFAADQINKNDI